MLFHKPISDDDYLKNEYIKYGKDFSILKVWLDERVNLCDTCGFCESIEPKVFDVSGEKMRIVDKAEFSKTRGCFEAFEGCPVGVISMTIKSNSEEIELRGIEE